MQIHSQLIIRDVRRRYLKDLKVKDHLQRQIATALYFIDTLALVGDTGAPSSLSLALPRSLPFSVSVFCFYMIHSLSGDGMGRDVASGRGEEYR